MTQKTGSSLLKIVASVSWPSLIGNFSPLFRCQCERPRGTARVSWDRVSHFPYLEHSVNQVSEDTNEDGNRVVKRYAALNGLKTETPKVLKSPTLRVTTVSL
jgi:hypothetical protein